MAVCFPPCHRSIQESRYSQATYVARRRNKEVMTTPPRSIRKVLSSAKAVCPHAFFEREYINNKQTRRYVCVRCKHSFSRAELRAIFASRPLTKDGSKILWNEYLEFTLKEDASGRLWIEVVFQYHVWYGIEIPLSRREAALYRKEPYAAAGFASKLCASPDRADALRKARMTRLRS